MSTIGLTSIGAIVGGVTMNPFILGVLTGTGVMIKGYMSNSNVSNKVERLSLPTQIMKRYLLRLEVR